MDEKIIARASEIIFSNEGGYASVNRDDNGALSLGRLQWHGTRALNLLKKIVKALGEERSLAFITDELYKEIVSARSWSRRTVSALEEASLAAILSTEESQVTQNVQIEADVSSYLEHIASLGVTDEDALIFMADIENQGGAGASERIITATEGKDIDSLYVAACNDDVFKNYIPRRARVYYKLTGHPYGEQAYEGELYEIRYGDTLSAIAREYGVSVSEIADLNRITNPSFIRTGDILKIPPQQSSVYDPEPHPQPDASPVEDKQDTYTVQRGDTLSGIGKELGIPWRKIAEVNDIAEPYVIYAGQELMLPSEEMGDGAQAPIEHTVVRGDTLSALARRYNTTIQEILSANRKKYRAISADYIVVGWELVIPGGAE